MYGVSRKDRMANNVVRERCGRRCSDQDRKGNHLTDSYVERMDVSSLNAQRGLSGA